MPKQRKSYWTDFEISGKMSQISHGGGGGFLGGCLGGPSVDSRGTNIFWQVDLMPYNLYAKLEKSYWTVFEKSSF